MFYAGPPRNIKIMSAAKIAVLIINALIISVTRNLLDNMRFFDLYLINENHEKTDNAKIK